MTPGRDDDLSLSYDEGDGFVCEHECPATVVSGQFAAAEPVVWRCVACGELFTETAHPVSGRTVRTTVPATAVAPDHGAR